ncbi:uncharacterized protein LOC125035898 [Penaeus chinensis]|uniref:uncharacterized protein LOC125035898 n=1 Tax=Penaeus chinensis TaxID=139456 RepID=UPI001FB5748E|nr:uncharacterized protein LOC125035898 [Penaeus chinensis]
MGLAAAVLWLSASAAVARAPGVPPLRLDGNESSTDVILMRQEVRLEEMVMLLTEIRDNLADQRRVTDEPLRPSVTDAPRNTTTTAKTSNAPPTCPDKFQEVGGVCLHLANSKHVSWDEARVYCQRLGGDLIHGFWNAEAGQSLVRDKCKSLDRDGCPLRKYDGPYLTLIIAKTVASVAGTITVDLCRCGKSSTSSKRRRSTGIAVRLMDRPVFRGPTLNNLVQGFEDDTP